jgi:four helix bundle protein
MVAQYAQCWKGVGVSIKRFEELQCWQKARDLTRVVYGYTRQVDFAKDFRLSGQITGAAISIMNNICEGFDSRSNAEFARFLIYARRSCSEVQNCLYVALDQSYIATDEFQRSYDDCMEIRKMIDGLIRHLKK